MPGGFGWVLVECLGLVVIIGRGCLRYPIETVGSSFIRQVGLIFYPHVLRVTRCLWLQLREVVCCLGQLVWHLGLLVALWQL